MNNTLSKIIIFAAGAAIGSAVTWKIVKDKYDALNRKDITEMREYYDGLIEKLHAADIDEDDIDDDEIEDDEIEDEYAEYVEEARRYTSYSTKNNEKKEEEDEVRKPYVISPDEFDENGYDTVSLTYYTDGVVTTAEDDEVLADETIEEWIGRDSLNHFGEYEEDSVFVRNDRLKTDFEILRDTRRFSEV